MQLLNKFRQWQLGLRWHQSLGFVLLVAGLALAMMHGVQRLLWDQAHKQASVVLEWADLQMLAKNTGRSATDILADWAGQHLIQSLAVGEDTIPQLLDEGRLSATSGATVLNELRTNRGSNWILANMQNQNSIQADAQYIVADDYELFERIKAKLLLTLGSDRVKDLGFTSLEVKIEAKALENIGLGFSATPFGLAKQYHLGTIARFKPNPYFQADDWAIAFRSLAYLDQPPHVVLFDGDEVGGYPDHIAEVARKLKKEQLRFGIIEFSQQSGDQSFAAVLVPQVLRVHSVTVEEMKTIRANTWLRRLLRAARERHIGLLYVHPFLDPHRSRDLLAYNTQRLKDLNAGLADRGIATVTADQLDPTQLLTTYGVMRWLLSLLVVVAIFSGGAAPQTLGVLPLLLGLSLVTLPLLPLSVLNWTGAWYRLLALITACAVPVLTLQRLRILGATDFKFKTLPIYVGVVGAGLLGGLWVGILACDDAALLSVRVFSGVKIALLLPVLGVAALWYFSAARWQSWRYTLRSLLNHPVLRWQVLVAVLVAGAGALYVLRSGNYIKLQIPFLDDVMRDGLERLLGVRPRTKEFLLAYPALWLLLKRLPHAKPTELWPLAALATLAPVSIINSFCHFHTPLLQTMLRCGWGALLGLLVGILAQWTWEFFRR